MAHSNLVFTPPFTTNFGYPKKTPNFRTIVQTPVSARGEIRYSLQPYPIWTIDYPVNFLRGAEQISGSDYQYLLGFFLAMGGMFSDFLYQDPYDNAVSGSYFGTGDGTTTQFQLIRSIGIGTDIVQNVNGGVTVTGSPGTVPGYTVGSTGIVTFASAPSSGMVLLWTGNFYYRVRFDTDEAEFDEFMAQIWSMGSLKLRSVIL